MSVRAAVLDHRALAWSAIMESASLTYSMCLVQVKVWPNSAHQIDGDEIYIEMRCERDRKMSWHRLGRHACIELGSLPENDKSIVYNCAVRMTHTAKHFCTSNSFFLNRYSGF